MNARNSLIARCLLLLIILLAFAIRLYHLDAQSIWSDEGLSVYRAQQDVMSNLRNEIIIQGTITTDTNPPLYFLGLAALRAIAGDSEFVLRFFSVCWGVLSVPLLFALARRLLRSDLAALCAAALGAMSPFYVWHSQELRMYPLVVDLALLSALALTYILPPDHTPAPQDKRKRHIAAFGLVTVALLYTHYTGFYLLAFEGLALLIVVLLERRWRVILGLGLALLAALPLILYAIQRLGIGKEPYYGGFSLERLSHEIASTFSLGWTFPPRRPLEQLVIPLALLAGGLLSLAWQRRWRAWFYLAAWLTAPIAALFAVSTIKSTYMGPRHLLIVSPAFYLAQAAGVIALPRRWRFLGLAALASILVGMALGLRIQFTDPGFVKDDIRGAVAYISARARPKDVVVVHDAIIGPTFEYYYDGAAPVTVIPPYPPQGEQDAIARLRQVAESHERVWFLYGPPPLSGFAKEVLPDWANKHLFKLHDRTFEGLAFYVGVTDYITDPPLLDAAPAEAAPVDHVWTSGLRLLAYQPPPDLIVGQGAWFSLYWRQESPISHDYLLDLQFLDEAGQVWNSAGGFMFDFWAADEWPLGRIIHQRQFVALPTGLPPSSYTLAAKISTCSANPALLDRAENNQLLGEALPLGQAAVSRPATPLARRNLDIPTWLFPARLADGVRLLGAAFPAGPFRPGHHLWVRLAWQVDQAPTSDYELHSRLLDAGGRVHSESVGAPSAAGFPTSVWRSGDLFYGQAATPIPAGAAPGLYQVQARLVDPASGQGQADWATLGLVKVEGWPFLAELPPVEHTLEKVQVGESIHLRGYDLAQSADNINLTLYWQAQAAVEGDYIVFVHLGHPDQAPVAQIDGIPASWLRPTSGWRSGEIIIDAHQIALPPEIPPGNYTLYAGLYTHQGRLPVWLDGQPAPDARIPLTKVEID